MLERLPCVNIVFILSITKSDKISQMQIIDTENHGTRKFHVKIKCYYNSLSNFLLVNVDISLKIRTERLCSHALLSTSLCQLQKHFERSFD